MFDCTVIPSSLTALPILIGLLILTDIIRYIYRFQQAVTNSFRRNSTSEGANLSEDGPKKFAKLRLYPKDEESLI